MLIPVLVVALLLALNAVFAMSELALMTSSQSRLAERAGRGDRGAKAALKLASQPTRFLSTVQVGITLIGILAGAYGEKAISVHIASRLAQVPGLEEHGDLAATVLVVCVITYFSLVLGELVPKRLALAFPETMSSTIARPLSVLSRVMAAPAWFLTKSTEAVLALLRVSKDAGPGLSEADVKALVSRAASLGVLTPQEHDLLQRTMRADDLHASDLMVPRQDMVWLPVDAEREVVRDLIVGARFGHYPVCRGGVDEVVGVVSLRDMIAGGLLHGSEWKLGRLVTKPLFIPETCPALLLLGRFRETDSHLAVVVDEYGGISGLLTVGDVVRAIVGDMSKSDLLLRPGVVQRPDGSWLIDGRLPVADLVRVLGVAEESLEEIPQARTAAGVVIAVLGSIPNESEGAVWEGWRLEVVDMDGARIDKLLATRQPKDPPE